LKNDLELDLDKHDERILEVLFAHPQGLRYNELKHETGLNNKVFDHHLNYLENETIVKRIKKGKAN